jgi:hypothetical protein
MSTIKVDTLQTRAGSTAAVTGAGFVATDQIRGNTAANSVTVVAEGGTNTTNLQQGLCKAWIHLTGSGTPAAADSFNVASITDTATGRYTINIATDFGNANYTCAGMSGNDGTTTGGRCQMPDLTPTAGAFAVRVYDIDGDAAIDDTNVLLNFHGDLA